MKVVDLRRYPRDERGQLAEEGTGIRTSGNAQGSVMFPRPPSIQERVYCAVLASGGAVCRSQIARALGLKVTPWLIQQIESLVADGYLRRLDGQSKQGFLMFWYEVAR